jgi:hypothetical protein
LLLPLSAPIATHWGNIFAPSTSLKLFPFCVAHTTGSMSTTTESLFKALLELSGNPALAATRNHVLTGIDLADLQTLVNYNIGNDLVRRDPRKLLLAIFDIAAEERSARDDRK